jgi:hypothetical protein
MAGLYSSFDLSCAPVYDGSALYISWSNFAVTARPGTFVTEPSANQVSSIVTSVYTLAPDGKPFQGETFDTAADLQDSCGNLITGYTQGDLTTGSVYIVDCTFTFSDDTSLNAITTYTVTQSPGLLSRAQLTGIAGDQEAFISFGYILESSSVLFVNNFANLCLSEQDGSYNFTGVVAQITANPGTVGNVVTQTYILGTGTYAADFYLNNGLAITGLQNNVQYEIGAKILSNYSAANGHSNGQVLSTTVLVTPSDRPSPPTILAAVSTLEYNRDASGQSQYTVTDASSVTILFQGSPEATSSPTLYTIYRFDVSSNGYTPVAGNPVTRIIPVDQSGNYPYGSNQGSQPIDGGEVIYKYKWVDTSVTPGKYYGYYIKASNINGEGEASEVIGVKVGQKAGLPVINVLGSNGKLIVNVTPSTSYGGFTSSSNYYYKLFDTSANTTIFYGPTTLDASNNINITSLTNGITYNVNVYGSTTNSSYTDPGTVVSSLNTGNTLYYLSTPSATSSLAPYQAPNVPTNLTALPTFDASGITPQGTVTVAWTGDTSFNSFPIGFIVGRYDVCGNYTQITTLNPADPPNNRPPPAQMYVDASVNLGSPYTYSVQSFYIVNNQQSASVPTAQSAPVTPFTAPASPSFGRAYSSGTTVNFLIAPSTAVPPANSGGLLPIKYRVLVKDPSQNVVGTYSDVSANVLTTLSTGLTANTVYTLTLNAYITGYNRTNVYGSLFYSPTVTETLQPTVALPVIVSANIDASGVLTINTQNNGSQLVFAEALIQDASAILNISLNTNLDLNTTTMTTVSNTATGSVIRVNFSDLLIGPSSRKLVVISNAVGAAVLNTLS